MKKSLAILLSFALILCMIPSTAFAAGVTGGGEEVAVQLSSTKTLYTGKTIQLPSITCNPQCDDVIVKWTDSSGGDVTGSVTNAGVYKASFTKEGTIFKPSELTFEVEKVDFDNIDICYTGSTDNGFTNIDLNSVVVKQNNVNIDISLYNKSKELVDNGKAVRIKITPIANANIKGGERWIDVQLTTKLDGKYKIVGSGKDGSIPDQTYNDGKPLEPTIYVQSITNPSERLQEGTDYKVEYTNNTLGSSTANVKVTGMNSYSGSLTSTFSIIGKDINYVSVKVSNTPKEKQPELEVKDGTKKLVYGEDYTYNSYDSTTVGTNAGTVTIKGNKNYTGTKTVKYNVISENNVLDSDNVIYTTSSKRYNGSVQQAPVVVKVDNNILSPTYDYELSYTYDNGKTTLSPKDAGTYSVYVAGKGAYASNGKIFAGTFTIIPVLLDDAEIVLGSSTVAYGGVYVPKVSVRHKYLNFYFPETDYDVTYRNINYSSRYLKPTAVITPKAKSNLTTDGSVKKELTAEFSLASRSIYNCNINFTDYRNSKNYDGKANFKPTVVVKDYNNNVTLRENYDYKVTYKDAKGKVVYSLVDAGVYSVIVEGTGAYSGTQTLTYTIYGTDISGYTVTLRESSVNYDGRSHMPSIVSVKKGYYSSLSSNDYTVTYEGPDGKEVSAYNIKNSGTYKVIVTGKNGYSGSIYAEYRIIGKPQTVTVTGKPSGKIYATSDTFKLTGYATGAGSKVTYSSSNPSVASVSSLGYVTPKKVGKTVITVSTYGDTSYEPATKEVTIVISPKKAVLTQKPWTSGQKKLFKVRWNYQEGANRYQIMYSQDKSFKKGTYKLKSVNAHNLNATTQSTAVKGLKSGKRYYVKVRAIYQDKDYRGRVIKNYWGTWSNWRSVVVK